MPVKMKLRKKKSLIAFGIVAILTALFIASQIAQRTSDKYDTATLLAEQQTLNKEQMQELTERTLLVFAIDFDVDKCDAVRIEQSGNMYTLTYNSSLDAELAFNKYSKQDNVLFCEYDDVLETSTLNNAGDTVDTVGTTETTGTVANNTIGETPEVGFGSISDIVINDYLSTANPEIYDSIITDISYNPDNKTTIVVIDSGANGNYDKAYNVITGTSDVTDAVGHGTAMISIIENHLKDYAGQYEIIPIKIANDNGLGSVSALVKALEYASTLNPTVINLSLTSTDHSENDLIDYYLSKFGHNGTAVVVSAGNQSNDTKYFTPAKFSSPIVVASADKDGKLQSFSNFGDSVDYLVKSDSTSEAAAITSALTAKAHITGVYVKDVYVGSDLVRNYNGQRLEVDENAIPVGQEFWWCGDHNYYDDGVLGATGKVLNPLTDVIYVYNSVWGGGSKGAESWPVGAVPKIIKHPDDGHSYYYYKDDGYVCLKNTGPAGRWNPNENSTGWFKVKHVQEAQHKCEYSSATCTKAPTCSCGATSGTALGHAPVSSGNYAATCTSTGLQNRTVCSRCNVVTSAGSVIAALGHSYTATGALRSYATCTAAATYYKKCSRCGVQDSSYFSSGTALGHDMGSWYAVTNPTCTATGSQRRNCSRISACGYYETGTIPALGHNYATSYTYENSDGLTNGYRYKKCSRCTSITDQQYACWVKTSTGISSISGETWYNKGTTVTIDAVLSTGYNWSHWTCSGSSGSSCKTTTKKYVFTINKAHWFIANATPKQYTVTLNGNGATSTTHTTSITATYAASLPTVTVPSRVHTVTFNANSGKCSTTSATSTYVFNGYYTSSSVKYINANGTSAKNWDIDSATTLYANWTSKSVTLPTPTRTGYTFKGWYEDSSFTTKAGDAGGSYTPTRTITLYAKWEANTYTIIFDSNNKATTPNNKYGDAFTTDPTGSTASITATYDKDVTLTTNGFSRVGYTFAGWSKTPGAKTPTYSNGQKLTKPNFCTGAGTDKSITLYAIWEPITYTVAFNKGSTNSTVAAPASFTLRFDQQGNLTAKPSTLLGTSWKLVFNTNKPSNATSTIIPIEASAGNLSYAGWKLSNYSSTAVAASATYNGTIISDTATIKNLRSTSGTVTATAQWSDKTVNSFASPTLTGWQFKGWSETQAANTTYVTSYKITPSTSAWSKTIYAQWVANTYYVAYDKGVTNSGGTTSTSTHTYDNAVTLRANGFTGRSYTLSFNGNRPKDDTGTLTVGTVSNLQAKKSGTLQFVQWYITDAHNNNRTNAAAATNLGKKNYRTDNGGTAKATAQWASVTLNNYASPSLKGYKFNGYYTAASGGSKVTSVTVDPATSAYTNALFAQWTPITYTIRYNGNGNWNTSQGTYTQVITYDRHTALTTNKFTRADNTAYNGITYKKGYVFVGWGLSPNQKEPTYTNGQVVFNLTSTDGKVIDLYAIWRKEVNLTVNFNGGKYNSSTASSVLKYTMYNSELNHTFDIKTYYGTQTGTDYYSKGLNSKLTKTLSGVQQRFLGYSLTSTSAIPDSKFDTFAYTTRTENYNIRDNTTIYAIWEPVLQMTVSMSTNQGHSVPVQVTTAVDIHNDLGTFTVPVGTKNTALQNNALASLDNKLIGLNVLNSSVVEYSVSAKGRTNISFGMATDTRILDIYNSGADNTWYDGLNRQSDLLKVISNFTTVTDDLVIPKHLGTIMSHPSSNPDVSDKTTVYGIKFTCTQPSYYYEKYWNTDESISVYAVLFLKPSSTSSGGENEIPDYSDFYIHTIVQ